VRLKRRDVEPSARLALLRSLSDVDPAWLVWKHGESAATETGDIDSAAPRAVWPRITRTHRAWAAEIGLGPTISCDHAPGLLVLVACVGDDMLRLSQLDVYARVSRVAPALSLQGAAEVDRQGYRRLRLGAEGVLRLIAAVRRPGRPPRSRKELDSIRKLLTADPRGAELVAAPLGVVGELALSGARAVAAGSWDSGTMTRLELAELLQALRDPRDRLAWLRFRLGSASRCPVLAALAAGRVVPGDPEAWLGEVARSHEVTT
jgi:hypothetical protein